MLVDCANQHLCWYVARWFFGLFVLNFVVVELVKMDVWMAILWEACQTFLDDDEDDEANMGMALDQLQDIMDASPPR
jgi:hypothetical protein